MPPRNSPGTSALYGHSLALLTDLYQMTMAYGYWKLGRQDHEAVFYLSFRKPAFDGGFHIACGLHYFIDFLRDFTFTADDLQFLAKLKGNDDRPLFEPGFLKYLAELRFAVDVDAVPEGTAVFPHQPLVRVRGPILQAQLLETPLLNMVNFQTLIATKAARICLAAAGKPVVEFGLRRAQGIDGAVAASRAAYVGGCAATSNVLAGQLFDIPVAGTHAHSWVMSFDDERESFEQYAHALPNNCIFLVDTFHTLDGVRNAARVGQELEKRGHKMIGIRLDSGDLAYLSIEARKILDDAGLPYVNIVASNDLDENIIASLNQQGARIDVWGVGTRLATAYDHPALGGVYKLSAVREPGHPDRPWNYKLKLSEQTAKITTPGITQTRRFSQGGQFVADAIYNLESPPPSGQAWTIVDPQDMTHRKVIPHDTPHEDLLQPIFRQGKLVYDLPPIQQIRQRTRTQLDALHPTIKRLVNPHIYPVGMEMGLFDLRTRLILAARGLH